MPILAAAISYSLLSVPLSTVFRVSLCGRLTKYLLVGARSSKLKPSGVLFIFFLFPLRLHDHLSWFVEAPVNLVLEIFV